MFSLVSGVYEAYWAPQQIHVLLVGAPGTGKTSLLERIKVTEFDRTSSRRVSSSSFSSPSTNTVEMDKPILPLRKVLDGQQPGEEGRLSPTPHREGMLTTPRPSQRRDQTPSTAATTTTTPRGEGSIRTTGGSTPPKQATAKKHSSKVTTVPHQRSSWICPSPAKYKLAVVVDDDDDDDNNNNDDDDDDDGDTMRDQDANNPTTGANHQHSSIHPRKKEDEGDDGTATTLGDRGDSLESIDLNNNMDKTMVTTEPSSPTIDPSILLLHDGSTNKKHATRKKEEEREDFDQKSGAKMLSLDKIRPTSGMNLGKVSICGAQCRFWDLGGKLQSLWQRYYEDCDAVIFVWKEPPPPNTNNDNNNKNDDDDDHDDAYPPVSFEQQYTLLEQVRTSIADDVPFLVLVHTWDYSTAEQLGDVIFATAPHLLPNYHNPYQALCVANARTGQGIRRGLQWLIALAKQQQRVREKPFPKSPASAVTTITNPTITPQKYPTKE